MAFTFSLRYGGSQWHVGNTRDLSLGEVKEQERCLLAIVHPMSTVPSLEYGIQTGKGGMS